MALVMKSGPGGKIDPGAGMGGGGVRIEGVCAGAAYVGSTEASGDRVPASYDGGGGVCVMDKPIRMSACLLFRRSFASPSGHKWQWLQSRPFQQPPGFRNHAHGRHCPTACNTDTAVGDTPPPFDTAVASGKSTGKQDDVGGTWGGTCESLCNEVKEGGDVGGGVVRITADDVADGGGGTTGAGNKGALSVGGGDASPCSAMPAGGGSKNRAVDAAIAYSSSSGDSKGGGSVIDEGGPIGAGGNIGGGGGCVAWAPNIAGHVAEGAVARTDISTLGACQAVWSLEPRKPNRA